LRVWKFAWKERSKFSIEKIEPGGRCDGEAEFNKQHIMPEVIVRPLSTVEYTSVVSLFHCRQLV